MKLAALEWLELQSRKTLADSPIKLDQVITPSIQDNVQQLIPVRTSRQVSRMMQTTTGTERALDAINSLPTIPLPIRRLTPIGRLYETSKALARILILTDPLDIIED